MRVSYKMLPTAEVECGMHGYELLTMYTMFFISAWPIWLVVIHSNEDKEPKISCFGEILVKIEFVQVVSQLQV